MLSEPTPTEEVLETVPEMEYPGVADALAGLSKTPISASARTATDAMTRRSPD
jgi:hypothetical protein